MFKKKFKQNLISLYFNLELKQMLALLNNGLINLSILIIIYGKIFIIIDISKYI